jgi:hypothetical protein
MGISFSRFGKFSVIILLNILPGDHFCPVVNSRVLEMLAEVLRNSFGFSPMY